MIENNTSLFEQLNDRLGRLLSILQPPPASETEGGLVLGFQDVSNGGEMVYVKEDGGNCWYRFVDTKRVPIVEKSLIGKLTGMAVRYKDGGSYDRSLKLVIGFSFGKNQKVRIQSGIDTAFSKGFLTSMAAGTIPKDSPIQLTTQVGDHNTVLCTLYRPEDGEFVRGDYHSIKNDDDAIAMAEDICRARGIPFHKRLGPSGNGSRYGCRGRLNMASSEHARARRKTGDHRRPPV